MEEREKNYRAIAKCRLCGEIFFLSLEHVDYDTAVDDLDAVANGKEIPCIEQPHIINLHDCKCKPFKGSLGVADVIGYLKVKDTE